MVYEFSLLSPCCATEHFSSCRLARGHFEIFRFVIRKKKKLLTPVREITANEWLKGKEMPVIYSGGATEFESRCKCEIFSSPNMSRPDLGPTQPPLQSIPGFSPWDKAAGACSLPSTPASAEVKNEWSYTSTSNICLHGMY
jgi:hypothetical protein